MSDMNVMPDMEINIDMINDTDTPGMEIEIDMAGYTVQEEQARVEAEKARAEAETLRTIEFDRMKQEVKTASDSAHAAAQNANDAAGTVHTVVDKFNDPAVTVETLPPGSNATAEWTVSNGAPTLDLAIPRGEAGPQGERGEPGTPGEPGRGVPTGGTAGQILGKKSNNEFDTAWIDAPQNGIADVQINGTSVVVEGVVDIPANQYEKSSLVNIGNGYNGLTINKNGIMHPSVASNYYIDNRGLGMQCYLSASNYDYAVKAAMCDGKGQAWTPDEQAAARIRFGQEEINRDRERRIINLEYAAKGYLYREETDASSAYEKVLPGDICPWATLDNIGGRTLVWNQSYKLINQNYSQGTRIVKASEVDNYVTYYYDTPSTIPDNTIWLFSAEVTYPREAGFGIGIGSYSKIAVLESGKHTVRTTVNSGTNNYGRTIYVFTNAIPRTFQEGDKVIVENVVCINLTQMFGAGNEPTAEQFSAMFPADYYPYSEPTLMSFSSKEVISKGKNLLNIAGRTEIVSEGLSSNSSARDFNENQIWIGLSSNNYLIPNNIEKYSISSEGVINVSTRNNGGAYGYGVAFPVKVIPCCTYTLNSVYNNGELRAGFYDKDGNYISSNTITDNILTPEKCFWATIVFTPYVLAQPVAFLNNILTRSNNTTYTPYKAPISYTTEAIVQKYFPDGMKSAGSVHDEIDLERGVAIQRVGARAYIDGDADDPAMITDGTTTLYALDIPIETTITDQLPTDIEVEGGGSLTFVNDQGEDYRVSVPNQETWLVKLGGANA